MVGLIYDNFENFKEYCKELYLWKPEGAHDSSYEIRGELGTQMKKLFFMSLGSPDLEDCLTKIKEARKSDLSLDEWKLQYHKYLLLIAQRHERIIRFNNTKKWYQKKLDNVEPLDESNWNLWGSVRQIKFGRAVIDTLECDLDPVFGALLSPTGGIVGPGNKELFEGDAQDGIVMHGIVHDGGGYLYNYHHLGPGYNYLNTKWTLFSTSNPLSAQAAGIAFWEKFIIELEFAKLENVVVMNSDEEKQNSEENVSFVEDEK